MKRKKSRMVKMANWGQMIWLASLMAGAIETLATQSIVSNTGKVSTKWNSAEMRSVVGNIKIISANITSWRKQGDHVMAWNSDIVALQEVRLTEAAKVGTNLHIGKKGYKGIYGKGMGAKFALKPGGQKSAAFATEGGVAIMAKEKYKLMAAGANSSEARALFEQGRYVRGAIPIEAKGKHFGLHIVSLHNVPQHGVGPDIIKERNNSRMLEDLARLGDQPVILCLDTNRSESEVLEEAVKNGRYVDVGKMAGGTEGPEPTRCNDPKWDKFSREGDQKPTRPDKILVNRIAWEMIKKDAKGNICFKLKRDSKIPGHIPLEIELDAEVVAEQQTVLRHPKRIEVEKMGKVPEAAKIRIEKDMIGKYGEEIDEARREKKVDKAWKLASKAGELYLKLCLREIGVKSEREIERGGTSRLIKQTIAVESKRGEPETTKGKKSTGVGYLESIARKIQVKNEILKGKAQGHKEKIAGWSEQELQNKQLLIKGEIAHLWNKVRTGLIKEQVKGWKILARENYPDDGKIQWTVNVLTATRKKEENINEEKQNKGMETEPEKSANTKCNEGRKGSPEKDYEKGETSSNCGSQASDKRGERDGDWSPENRNKK